MSLVLESWLVNPSPLKTLQDHFVHQRAPFFHSEVPNLFHQVCLVLAIGDFGGTRGHPVVPTVVFWCVVICFGGTVSANMSHLLAIEAPPLFQQLLFFFCSDCG